MTKWWRYGLVAIVVLGGGYLAADWLGINIRRALMLTTADPDALGLVISESIQPVTLTLESSSIAQSAGPAPRVPSNQRVTFRIPAAYVNELDLKEGRGGSQRIGLEVWSRTFDPVAPDVIADRRDRKCPVGGPCYAQPTDRVQQRMTGGEFALQIRIGNGTSAEAHRNYVLSNLDGARVKKPCKIFDDPDIGMIVAETPEGLRPGQACNFIGNPAIRRDGKSFPPRNFLKLNSDGAPKFNVRCRAFSSDEEDQRSAGCLLRGYFGIWPISIRFRGSRPKEWGHTYEHVQQFLTKYVIERTD